MSKTRLTSGPGPRAKRSGTPAKNGKGIPIWSYPRERTRSILVQASEKVGQSLGSFLILAGLEKIARAKAEESTLVNCAHLTAEDLQLGVQDLIPAEEYAELLRKRGGKGSK
jgi:hypothetical protein